jgi:hypothetical protein
MSQPPSKNHPINRREFLGASAANAAGLAAAGVVGMTGLAAAKSAPGERMAVGVIGVRSQGKALAELLAGFPDVDVAALCDVDEGLLPQATSAIEARQGHAPRIAADFRRLLDDPALDAVIIATPDH